MGSEKDDEIIVEDGEVPMRCPECGDDFLWRVEDEDLPDRCPTCRAEAVSTNCGDADA